MDVADITFIGSGVATTFTLIELFGQLTNNPIGKKINITIIEKNHELWLGIPYGGRSSVNALTITHVYDFIYEPERPAFFEWLKANKKEWAELYLAQGGIIAARWLEKNFSRIENEDWESVYIPRFVFGKYLLAKLERLLKTVGEQQLAEVKIIHAEAIDIKNTDSIYEVTLEHKDQPISYVFSHKVVVATGSAPVKKMNENDDILYVNDIYDPAVEANFDAIYSALCKIDNTNDRNILIIGSNASAIELLYLLEGRADLRKLTHKTVVISPTGLLPYPISAEVIEHHAMPNLDQLRTEGNYNLETLIDATSSDIKLAVQNGANVSYIATIIGNTNQLLEPLGEEAKKAFIGIYGPRLSQMFRRSGPEYKSGSQLLIDVQEAILLKGKYLNSVPADNGISMNYLDTVTGQKQTYPLHFGIMINCSGSDNLAVSSSRLIHNLVNKHKCKVNLSGKGFEVNEKFETAPNLYVMGPLLGGNMNKLIHFWHLENAPRLMYLAPYLAGYLLEGYHINKNEAH